MYHYEECGLSNVWLVDGFEIDNRDLLLKNGYDNHEIAVKISENYIKQIVDDGFFHVFVTPIFYF